jgi:hypothetical protein
MTTRAHILDKTVMVAATRDDVSAFSSEVEGCVVVVAAQQDKRIRVTAREARQLAYQLCEAADDMERM